MQKPTHVASSGGTEEESGAAEQRRSVITRRRRRRCADVLPEGRDIIDDVKTAKSKIKGN